MKLPVTVVEPALLTQACEPGRIGLKTLLDPLTIVQDTSVGRKPLPSTLM
jgi:hypothetical protein